MGVATYFVGPVPLRVIPILRFVRPGHLIGDYPVQKKDNLQKLIILIYKRSYAFFTVFYAAL